MNGMHFNWVTLLALLMMPYNASSVFAESEWRELYEQQNPLLYAEIAGRGDPNIVGMGLGLLRPSDYVSARGMLVFLGSEPRDDFYTGVDFSLTLHMPWRLSPYVGLGLFAGYSKEKVEAEDDHKDNDEDGRIDERGEKRSAFDEALFTVYPELGFIWVLREDIRVNLSARYQASSAGRDFDEWVYAVGFTFGSL